MDEVQFDRFTASLTHGTTRRTALRGLGAALGLSGVSLLSSSTTARRRKGGGGKGGGKGGGGGNGGGGGGGGGTLGVFEICEPGAGTCQSGLRCDSPTTRHTCSSTVEDVEAWCCVPPGGACTECDCCGNFYCAYDDDNNPTCQPNPEG